MRNFMCYRDNVPPLYFDGIHTACLCGGNGNGKSALLDAITWALWGKTRARSDDELIHLGQQETEVEFEFTVGANRYRVLRKRAKTRPRHPGRTLLEFQVSTADGFSSISGNSLSETQQKIIRTLRMDYLTFANSAFLRQGRADEFTIKPPGERKRVLADILALSFYDEFEERAKNYAKSREQEERQLGHSIKEMEQEIEHKEEYEAELQEAKEAQVILDREVKEQESQVAALRDAKKALDLKQERTVELEREIEQKKEELNYWQNQVADHSRKVEEYERAVQEHSEVEQGYARLHKAKEEAEELNTKLEAWAALTKQKADLERVIQNFRGELIAERRLMQSKVEDMEAESIRIPGLEEELTAEKSKLDNIVQQEKALGEKRRQAQELALRIQHLKSTEAQSKQEVRELKDKLALLSQSDAKCPLCETDLGVLEKRSIEEKYRAEVDAKLDTQQKNELEMREGVKRHHSLEHEINQSESRINQQRTAAQNKAAILEKEISSAKEATIKLAEEKTRLIQLEERLAKGEFALPEQTALKEVEQKVADLGYDAERHQQVRQLLAELGKYEALKLSLEQAEKSLPLEREMLVKAKETVARSGSALEANEQKLASLSAEVAALPELTNRLNSAEQTCNLLLQRQAGGQKRLGAVQQKLDHCSYVEKTVQEKRQLLLRTSRERKIYEELAEAFGKKGIQAFLIESAIPEIEAEANRLLGQMTDDRMHVKIETQRETKKGETVETLDIKISDELGTRSYEMYSGGEAFRINFALRITLSKLLARRAGAPLPTLFIDEGFGTQDTSGLEKLVEAINSIQNDFEKIIVITHLEELKDAFPSRIEVIKTSQGSTISLS